MELELLILIVFGKHVIESLAVLACTNIYQSRPRLRKLPVKHGVPHYSLYSYKLVFPCLSFDICVVLSIGYRLHFLSTLNDWRRR